MSNRDEAGSPNRREEGTPRRMPRSSERGGSHSRKLSLPLTVPLAHGHITLPLAPVHTSPLPSAPCRTPQDVVVGKRRIYGTYQCKLEPLSPGNRSKTLARSTLKKSEIFEGIACFRPGSIISCCCSIRCTIWCLRKIGCCTSVSRFLPLDMLEELSYHPLEVDPQKRPAAQ